MDIKLKKISDIDGESKKVNHNSETFNIFSKVKLFTMKWESYFQVYDKIFKKYKDQKVTFVEVGVSGGGSLFIWREYFGKQARIIGIDFNPAAKKLEKYGFEIFIGNQSDKNFWKEFYRKIGKIDILFDDGGHKNIQQISTVENSLEHINDNGIIVVEDTHTSFLKEFKNPSYFSFINYCNKLIKNIHKRCEWVSKKNNIYSNKIWSIDFYESIVAINIDSKRCIKSSIIYNTDQWGAENDFRNNEYFLNTKKYIKNNLDFLNKIKITRKIIRKLFYKNIFIDLFEKLKILKIFIKMK